MTRLAASLLALLFLCAWRDDFTASGPLRYPWSGADTASFDIEAGALRSVSGTRNVVYDTTLPASQVVWARWSGLGGTDHDILLRCQNTTSTSPRIEVRYDDVAHQIRVATYVTSWTNRAQWGRTLVPGDTVTALVDSLGKVMVWHNKAWVGTVSTSGWPYAQSSGRAGVTMASGAARLDWFAASAYPVPPATPETIPPSAILSWTFPTHQVGPDGCEAGATLERALCGFVIEARPDTVGGRWACAWRGAWGKPGEVGRVGLPMDGVAQWFRIAAIDSAGNQTPCWSNEVRIP